MNLDSCTCKWVHFVNPKIVLVADHDTIHTTMFFFSWSNLWRIFLITWRINKFIRNLQLEYIYIYLNFKTMPQKILFIYLFIYIIIYLNKFFDVKYLVFFLPKKILKFILGGKKKFQKIPNFLGWRMTNFLLKIEHWYCTAKLH